MKNYNKLNHIQSFNTKDTKMKKLTILIALLVVVGFSTNAFAQLSASATASTTATIVTPIGISKTVDMNFGNIATTAAVGTVVLTPASGRTVTGGAALPPVIGTVTAASFAVTGSGTYAYAITLPGAAITLTGVPSGTVTVGTFTSTPSGNGALTAGAQTLLVGATLNLPVSTVAGIYSNAAGLSVTVNYN
jgi:hypothetical protein